MELDLRREVEVKTVHGLLAELDYYRILKLRPGAPMAEVERAFAEQSQTFHPDRFFGVRDPKIPKMATTIFKKVSEAYQVLRDPDLKKMYDKKMGITPGAAGSSGELSASGSLRPVDKASLEKDVAADDGVNDPRSRKYWELAQVAMQAADWNGAVMNLQFALNYDKDNIVLNRNLEHCKREMEERKRRAINPYKIKIV